MLKHIASYNATVDVFFGMNIISLTPKIVHNITYVTINSSKLPQLLSQTCTIRNALKSNNKYS